MKTALAGALAAAIAVMIVSGWMLIRPYYRQASLLRLAVFVGGAFGLACFGSLPPLRVLLVAAAAGLLWPQRRKA